MGGGTKEQNVDEEFISTVDEEELWLLRCACGSTDGRATFDRAGDIMGGLKEEKDLWIACQSMGDSTGGRVHGSVLFAFKCFDVPSSCHRDT